MGGSAGGGFFGGEVEPIESALSETERQELVARVNELLRELLQRFNDRDVDTIKSHLDQITDALGDILQDSIDLIFGGSVAKHTYVDGLSDIDSLLIIDRSHLETANPKELLRTFCNALEERVPEAVVDSISLGTLAATVKFRDGTVVQILPACKDGESIVIPSANGNGWRAVRPQEFASRLTQTNQRNDGRVVPVIKLAKSTINQFPHVRQLSGYHVEALAVEVFQGYHGTLTLRDMLTHFFKGAAERVMRPIVDSTGQSIHVDDSLGAAASLQRSMAADSLARVARRMESATSMDQWHSILGVD